MKQQNTLILKPAVQGTLDSLCGIYSVVNMLYWLYGPRIKRLTLFRALVHHLHEHHDIAECLTNGMDTPVVDCMLNFLQSSRYRRYPITVHRPLYVSPCAQHIPF